jgi:hypothetical protein
LIVAGVRKSSDDLSSYKPRVNLTRFHGVFAPNSAHRARVTKAGRGKGARGRAATETDHRTPVERRASMSWARRLKRVFNIDIETCSVYGGPMRIIDGIEDPALIEKILAHLDAKAAGRGSAVLRGDSVWIAAAASRGLRGQRRVVNTTSAHGLGARRGLFA